MQNCSFFSLFQYFKDRFFAPQRGALYAAELRWLFYVVARGRVVTMLYSACMPRVRPTAVIRRTTAEG